MRRGDVVLVDLDPVMGSEANEVRPAVVVSNDLANQNAERLGRGVITVVPLTSNVTRLYSFQVLVPKTVSTLTHDSKAQAEQVRAVDVRRCGEVICHLPDALQRRIDEALRLHLWL